MANPKPVFGAFNQGVIPTIACFNKAATPLGVDFDALIAAMQVFVDQDVVPVWGTPAKLVKSTNFLLNPRPLTPQQLLYPCQAVVEVADQRAGGRHHRGRHRRPLHVGVARVAVEDRSAVAPDKGRNDYRCRRS